ncbi:MAG TPA: glutathione S-transferase N-terminal domain-containing protein [Rhizomicrobium sp.]
MITIYAYKWVPPQVQGLVRDLRPRWALEEAGIPYTEKLIGLGEDQASDWYRALQPFGQVPAMEESGLELFESVRSCCISRKRATCFCRRMKWVESEPQLGSSRRSIRLNRRFKNLH